MSLSSNISLFCFGMQHQSWFCIPLSSKNNFSQKLAGDKHVNFDEPLKLNSTDLLEMSSTDLTPFRTPFQSKPMFLRSASGSHGHIVAICWLGDRLSITVMSDPPYPHFSFTLPSLLGKVWAVAQICAMYDARTMPTWCANDVRMTTILKQEKHDRI